MSHSKSLAGNRGIAARHNEIMTEPGHHPHHHHHPNHAAQIQNNNSQSIQLTGGIGKVGGLAMASISSHNLAINKSNDLNRRISQSPYSFQAKLNNQIHVGAYENMFFTRSLYKLSYIFLSFHPFLHHQRWQKLK